MIASLWVCVGLLAQSPPASATDWDAYKQAAAHAGRSTEAHIKLALWCESHRLDAERLKHLARAVLIDPKNATARGILGLVDYRGRWQSPEAVSKQVKTDEALSAKLSEYERQRAEVEKKVARLLDQKAIVAKVDQFTYDSDGVRRFMLESEADARRKTAARAHVLLATWCEKNDLKPEAIAHFTEASQIDPKLITPWEHLGCKKHKGRRTTEEQIVAEQREIEAQHRADRHWEPLLRKWMLWLGEKSRRDDAEAHLAKVNDPRTVPSIWKVLVSEGAIGQRTASQLLSQIDSPSATHALVMLAVFSVSDDVRQRAPETLTSRDPRDVVPSLIKLIRTPLQYKIEPACTPRDRQARSVGTLVVEGRSSIIRRSYFPGLLVDGSDSGTLLETQTIRATQQRLLADIQQVNQLNQTAEVINPRVLSILGRVTGQTFPDDVNTWMRWWDDQQGYVYEPPKPGDKPISYQSFTIPHAACFAAGTLVQTRSDPQPIESLQLGDTVLSQDTRTGALIYQPVIAFHRNPPNQTLRIRVTGETIVTTGIHRFWKAGQGWVMARDLKPGDSLRIVGGTARIERVEPDTVQPVYNLDVASNRNFFIGKSGLLVHDFSLVESIPEPFDAVPSLEER